MTKTLILIPAWNEESALPSVLTEIKAAVPDIDVLVIDDGSSDNTAASPVWAGYRCRGHHPTAEIAGKE